MSSSKRRVWWFVASAGLLALALNFARNDDTKQARSAQTGQTVKRARAHEVHEAPAAIEGVVLDESRKPIVGAQVCAMEVVFVTDHAARLCVASGDSGEYRVAPLPSSSYVVSARADGFESLSALQGTPLHLSHGEQRQGLEFTLKAAIANLSGEVRDAVGGVVPGALVRVTNPLPPAMALETTTDDVGRFALHVPEGMSSVSASAEGYSTIRRAAVVPSKALVLVLSPASSISGVVQLADGTEVADVEVHAQGGSGSVTAISLPARSDGEGRFVLSGLAPGTYRLSGRGRFHEGSAPVPIDLELGANLKDVDLVVSEATRVHGTIVRAAGGFCPRGVVVLAGIPDPTLPFPEDFLARGNQPLPVTPQVTNIRGEGEVEFKGVPAGDYYATVRCDGHVFNGGPKLVQVGKENDVGPFQWEVTPAATLLVRAVDEAGTPVARAPLRLLLPAPGPKLGRGLTPLVTDERGEAHAQGLSAGSYVVQAADPTQGESVEVTLRPGQLKGELSLTLFGKGSLLVQVEDGDGRPLDELQVLAKPLAAKPISSHGPFAPDRELVPGPRLAMQMGLGRHRIAPLPAGRYQIVAADGMNPPDGETSATNVVDVQAGEETRFVLKLDRGAKIEGRVADARGTPAANVWVSARSERDAESKLGLALDAPLDIGRVLTDQEGNFTLSGLEAKARYTLTAQRALGSEAHVAGVVPGQTPRITLPDTGSIEGDVRDEAGAPARAFVVQARAVAGGAERTARLLDEGRRFVFDRVPSGELELLAVDHTGKLARTRLQVAPGEAPTKVALALAAAPTSEAPSEEAVSKSSARTSSQVQ